MSKAKPCPVKPGLTARPQLSLEQSAELEDLFKVLANDTRLRMLHAVAKQDEIGVGDLAALLEMKTQAVSNQLQRMQDLGIVASRRDGTSIRYRIVDRCVLVLIERGLCLLEENEKRARRSSEAKSSA